MRGASENLRQALLGSFDVTFEADLFYGEERLFANLPIAAPSLDWDGTADVEASGSAEVLWTDAHGSSLKPELPSDWLAPFGSRLVVYAVVSAPPFKERVQLGVFTITDVPSADDYPAMFGQMRITVGSRVEVSFKDRMVEVQDDRFTRLAQPSQLASVYAELATLTGFQLTRTVADGGITRSVVYEESRVKAVQDLAGILNAVPFMESDGTLSLRSNSPGEPVAQLEVGSLGTIVQVGASLSREGVYNGIVIRGETNDQQAILAERWVTQGPLRASTSTERTPFHRRPRFYSSPFITTQAQAEAAIDDLLEQFSQPRAAQLQVQCVVNPLLQVGDVVTVFDGRATWTVRLVKVSLGAGALMTVTGDVIDREFNL